MGPRGTTAGVPHARTQAFDKALAYTKPPGDRPLRQATGGQRIGNPLS
jgi:hypothetical protein